MSKIMEAEHLEMLNKLELYKKSASYQQDYMLAIENIKNILLYRFGLSPKQIEERQRIV